jgi:molybdate transport system substrate-binding protein
MKRLASLIVILFTLVCALVPMASAQQPEILVSAAASLTDVLSGLAPQAEQSIGAKLVFNFGASGSLRRQIEEGAPVDVFFSASSEDVDKLLAKGLLVAGTRKDLLSNKIVLIGGPRATPIRAREKETAVSALKTLLSGANLVAVGNPDTVPAGRYAVLALTSYGLYPIVKSKLALGGSVREVLQFVQSGSAPLGIVFLTDALTVSPDSIQQLFVFPDEAVGVPILYPVAVVNASKNKETAEKLIEFLQGDIARNAFRSAGFLLK